MKYLSSLFIQSLFFLQILICVFAQLQFPSSHIKIPNGGPTFYFHFNEQNKTILMGLEMNRTVDFFGVGFADEGNYGMSTFDIVACVFVPNTNTPGTYTVNILDLYSTHNGRPPTDVSLGGTADYHLVDYYVVEGKHQVLFQRAWDTKDKFDYVLDPEKTKRSLVMNWAWVQNGQHALSFHGPNAGTVITKMYNGFQGEATPYAPGWLSTSFVVGMHGYGMLFTWAILIEFIIQIGRYMKYQKHFITIHACLAIVVYGMTIISEIFVLYIASRNEPTESSALNLHKTLGIIIALLLTAQVMFGAWLGLKVKNSKETMIIPSLDRVHLFFGITICIITKIQIAVGLYMFNSSLLVYLYIYYGLLLIFRVYQEYKYMFIDRISGKSLKTVEKEDSQVEIHQELLNLLNGNAPMSYIMDFTHLHSLKWAILDDKVFSIKDFTHPGGNFIWDHINGREVGRYIYGAYGLLTPQNSTQHSHSTHALKIIEKNFIGTIQTGQEILTLKYETENYSPIRQSSLEGSRLLPILKGGADWVLDNKIQITPYISKFEFKCKNFYINANYQDIRHLGRHMKVSHASQSKIRLYTLVFSQTEYRIRKREELWHKYMKKSGSPSKSKSAPSDTLPLLIKNYNIPNVTTFSNFLHNSVIGTEGFSIEGPYGYSLGLTPESSGIHYIFAAGTGIFPFIDLFDFLLERAVDNSGTTYNIFQRGFKLHVFASFAQIDDFIGLEICEKLIQVCRAQGYGDAFKLILRATDAKANELYEVTNEKFNYSFMSKNVNQKCVKAYVCGPPDFNNERPVDLKAVGISKDKIMLV